MRCRFCACRGRTASSSPPSASARSPRPWRTPGTRTALSTGSSTGGRFASPTLRAAGRRRPVRRRDPPGPSPRRCSACRVRARAVLRVRSGSTGSWRGLVRALDGFRPPLSPEPFEIARHLDHGAAGVAPRGDRDPQPADERLRQRARRATRSAFPVREVCPSGLERGRPLRARVLAPQGAVRGDVLARSDYVDLGALAALPDEEVHAILRGFAGGSASGRSTGSSHATSRGPRAWPAGDLALRKALPRASIGCPLTR